MSTATETSQPLASCELTAADVLWVCEILAVERLFGTVATCRIPAPAGSCRALAACEDVAERQRLTALIDAPDTFAWRTDSGFVIATAGQSDGLPHVWQVIEWGLAADADPEEAVRPLIQMVSERGDVEVPVDVNSRWQSTAIAQAGAVVTQRIWGKSLPGTSAATGHDGPPQAASAQAPKRPHETPKLSAETPKRLEVEGITAQVVSATPSEQIYTDQSLARLTLQASAATTVAGLDKAETLAVSLGASTARYVESPQDDAIHSRELTDAGYDLHQEVWQLPSTG